MRKFLIILFTLSSLSMADSVLLIKKGWQLVGSSTNLNISKFKLDSVEQVWHFDAITQKWLGYSPDASIQSRMDAQHVNRVKELKSWHGFWIKSKKDWTLTLKDKSLSSEPINSKSSDIIELKKGWNLISLPVNLVVSADIFKDMTVWKYNSKNKWELSDKADSTESFPPLGHIKNSDGLWVKSDNDKNISVVEEASKLHNFKTQKEMESYITEMATIFKRPYCGIEPFVLERGGSAVNSYDDGALYVPLSTNESSNGVKNASSTNLQESDVDEADILKHNGKYIFYVGKKDSRREHINVTSFNALTNGKKPEFKSISFSDRRNIDSFYLVDKQLVVISSLYPTYEIKDSKNIIQSLVDIFDISDIKNIKKVANYKVEGYLKNSRVVDKKLYLITTFTPQYSISYPKEYLTPSENCKKFINGDMEFGDKTDFSTFTECYNINQEDGKYFRYNYDNPNVKVTNLLPKIEGTSLNSQNLITPKRLYASAKQNQVATMTTISSFSLTDSKYLKSTSYIGDSSIEYASSNSLYLLSYAYPFYYDFNNYKQRSMVYKFNFNDDLSYQAVGAVYGTALNQFSLSEYNNILRLATTEGFSWGTTGTKNRLYTLKENQGLLNIEGTLNGLGKEGESIKSVRFMGDRAYLVTFKTTDPLYTIDLSNPKAPKKMGELEVDGYSDYLHPVSQDRLLGIGQSADSDGKKLGVKIELFDVSDFENPTSLDSIVLAKGTSSEIEYNHKALAYRASDNLFAFPYRKETHLDSFIPNDVKEKESASSNNGQSTSSSSNSSSEEEMFIPNSYQITNYLGIYQVDDNSLKSYSVIEDNSTSWGGNHRGLIFDNNNMTYVGFFSDDKVISKKLKDK